VSRAREFGFSVAVTLTSRILLLRDRLLGRIPRRAQDGASQPGTSRHCIQSGLNALDAVFVKPVSSPVHASVLICHGIGETVQHWLAVQQLLAENGVASLVFDYSGYGHSSGFFTSTQSELDAISAFRALQQLTESIPISVLGFSLGSGVATAIIEKVPARHLILCAAFTSLQKAAYSVGIPKPFSSLAPPIWNTGAALATCPFPLLVVHGENDRLFPVGMAKELATLCSSEADLLIAPNTSHNQPYARPELSYWGPIISWISS
jgi:pimeloyl-ACP methyl ester carboxylesterase